jgi:Tol biopolymer transport system component/DNA-binding winged helix-turn-helix (wHTH) protein
MNAVVGMSPGRDRFLAVGDHVVDTDTLRLLSAPDGARLTPKAAAVLLQLVRAQGRTLSRDELLNEVWKGTCPTPDVLTQAVKDLRRALGDDLQAPRYVETLPRLGYRLVAPARFVESAEIGLAPPLRGQAEGAPKSAVSVVSRLRGWWPWFALGVAMVLVLLVRPAITSTPGTIIGSDGASARWHVSERRSISAEPGAESAPRVSPDGTRVAYMIGNAHRRDSRIVQRSLGASRVVELTATANGEQAYPVWSPDGAMIAYLGYVGNECRVMIAPALGGEERVVAPCSGQWIDYFSWAPDARQLLMTPPVDAGGAARAIALVPIDGGIAAPLVYQRATSDMDLDARYSPDGSRIAFRRGTNPYSDLFLMDAHGGDVRQLTRLASSIRGFDWTRDGESLVFSSGHAGQHALYTVSIDDGRIEALDVQPAEYPSTARASDTVVYEIPRQRTRLVTVPLGDAAEGVRDLVSSTGSDSAPALAPTGERLAFTSDRGGGQQLWLHDRVSDETYALTDADEPNLRYPVWRADGTRVLITARGEGWGHLIEIDAATHTRTVLTSPDDDVRYGVYASAPGRYVAIIHNAERRRELVEFESRDGRAISKRVLARDVGRIDYDNTGATLYFTRISEPGLFRIDARTGAETLVALDIAPQRLDGWLVSAGQFYYLATHAIGRGSIHVIDPATGVDRELATIPAGIADLNFSIAPDHSHAVVVCAAAVDSDIGAISLRPAGGLPIDSPITRAD